MSPEWTYIDSRLRYKYLGDQMIVQKLVLGPDGETEIWMQASEIDVLKV